MRKKILLLGSSMTQRSFSIEHHGWGASLANWYCRTGDVLNRGAGGYNSKWCKLYLPKLLGNEQPDLTILFIGNNDTIDESEKQHVSISDYKANLHSILDSLYTVNANMAVLLVTPTCVNHLIKTRHCNQRRAQYAEVVRDIVKYQSKTPSLANKSLNLVDLWSGCDHSEPLAAEDLHDGAHLNRVGNRKVWDKVKLAINRHCAHLSPDSVKHKGNKRRAAQLEAELELSSVALMQSKKQTCTVPTASPAVQNRKERGDSLSDSAVQKAGTTDTTLQLLEVQEGVSGLQLTVPLWHEIPH